MQVLHLISDWDQPVSVSALIAGLLLLLVVTKVFSLFFSHLSPFPGPTSAKLSPFWLTQQCRNTRRSEAVMRQHAKYGKFIRIAPSHISINDPTALAEIYSHKAGFTKGDFYDAFVQVKPVVFNARDPVAHARKRKYVNPAFSARALSEFEPYMDVELLGWKRKLLGMAGEKGRELDFTVWTNYLAFDIIGSFAFGKPFGFVDKGHDPYNLISTIDARGEVLNALGTVPNWLRHYMRYFYFDSFWSSGLRATANLENIGREAFSQRKADTSSDRKDLLSFLFAAKDSTSNEPLPEAEIVAESISFIVGGSDTTSSTMTNFIDIVSRNSELQRRLQEELDAAFPGVEEDDAWVPADKDVSKLPLLVAVLREVMRFRPTSSTGLERVTPQGGRILAGKFVPENTLVSVPTCGIMMNPDIFKDPTEFRPERWLEPDAHKMLEYFVPFSLGPRACIGRNFAWMEILKAVVLVFKHFDVERLSRGPTIIREGFFNKASECKVRISRRSTGS